MTSNSLRAGITSFVLVFALSIVSLAMISSGPASAATGPLLVSGYVTDNAGHTMEGVPVTVVSKNAGTTVKTLTTTTDADGFYTVTFGGMEGDWDVGFTITSIAQSGATQESETVTIVDETPTLQINIQFPFEIPQFGNVLGFILAAALVGSVAGIMLVHKRPKKNEL